MARPPRGLFRKEALDRVASPERLDDLVTIIEPWDWLALVGAIALTAVVIAWSVWGTLPTTVNGHGVLARPRQVVPIQSVSDGRVAGFGVKPGDRVEAGQLVVRLDRAEVEGERREQRTRLDELQAQDRRKRQIEDRALALQQEEIRIARVSLDLRRDRLERQVRDGEALTPVLAERLASQRKLLAEGLIPPMADSLLDAEQDALENHARVADLQTNLKQLDIDRAQLDTRQERLRQERLETTTERQNQMDEIRARIAVLDAQLAETGEIRAQAAGRILELVVEPGQVVVTGGRLAMLELDQGEASLRSVLYFTTGDGKRLRAGMPAYITPDVVPRERYGGIVGRIASVAELPTTRESVAMTLGNAELADALIASEPRLEVVVELETDPRTPSGYRWSSSTGPPLPISAGTIATGRVTVEGRAPISYVLPFLRSVSGVY